MLLTTHDYYTFTYTQVQLFRDANPAEVMAFSEQEAFFLSHALISQWFVDEVKHDDE